MEIKDSGERRQFDTGAVRDIQEGKGRCDLMPLYEVSDFLNDKVLDYIASLYYVKKDDVNGKSILAFYALNEAIPKKDRYKAVLDLSHHYADGAKKYGERNWEKGMPSHCYIDSAVRHYLKHKAGWDDEPHFRAFFWNILGYIWTVRNKPELDDYYWNDSNDATKESENNEEILQKPSEKRYEDDLIDMWKEAYNENDLIDILKKEYDIVYVTTDPTGMYIVGYFSHLDPEGPSYIKEKIFGSKKESLIRLIVKLNKHRNF